MNANWIFDSLSIYRNTKIWRNKLKRTYPKINILPIFIFNKNQIEPSRNPYFSHNAFEFMCDSLQEIPSINCYLTDNDLTILNDLKTRFKIKNY